MIRRVTTLAMTLVASAAVALAATGTGAVAATADPKASGGGISITEVDATRFPTVRVAFGADGNEGKLPPLKFHEDGKPLAGASLYRGPIGEYQDAARTDVMLVFDTSLSMGAGTRFDDAVAAAKSLLDHAREGDMVGLATFGGTAKVVVGPTTNHRSIEAALENLQLANRTTMFDAVAKSAQAFDRKANANRAIVLLSDGTDVGSRHTAAEAAGEARKAQAPVFAVAIREDVNSQPKDLADLGNGTGGELQTVAGTATLGALFDDLGRRILQPYWVEYRSSSPVRSSPRFGVSVGDGAIVASTSFRAIPKSAAAAAGEEPPTVKPAEPILPVPGGMAGVLLASLPFALLVFILSLGFLTRRSTPDVLARIERYTARASADVSTAGRKEDGAALRGVAAPFVKIGDTFLGKSAFFERSRQRAEQAAIAIRPAELFAAMVCGFVVGLLLALMLGKLLLFVVLPAMLGSLPNVWLRMKARKRRNIFDDQLPDVLQGISSSLKAGHSFNQAIAAMIKDAPNPTSEEFSRVMTEARLGMPIEDALQSMAERMGSADFDFAVTTVNIQRTVGGSLADILEMVGDTVRNRQQFRKKVKALTSMGQMSAYVLIAMPIVIGAVITLMSSEYMAPLYTTTTGHILMAIGAVSMTLGYFACMKVVSVKV